MSVFVDTSAFLAILNTADLWHDEAVRIYRGLLEHDELVTTNYVAVESIQLVRRRLGAAAAEALLRDHLPVVTTFWVDEATHRAAERAFRPAGGTSFVDEVSFTVMRGLGIDVALAFDDDFDGAGFTRASARADAPRRWLREVPAPYGTTSDVDSPDIVSVTEIARRSGRSVNTVQSWRRRHPDFPAPRVELAAGPIWSWRDVQGWIDRRAGALP